MGECKGEAYRLECAGDGVLPSSVASFRHCRCAASSGERAIRSDSVRGVSRKRVGPAKDGEVSAERYAGAGDGAGDTERGSTHSGMPPTTPNFGTGGVARGGSAARTSGYCSGEAGGSVALSKPASRSTIFRGPTTLSSRMMSLSRGKYVDRTYLVRYLGPMATIWTRIIENQNWAVPYRSVGMVKVR